MSTPGEVYMDYGEVGWLAEQAGEAGTGLASGRDAVADGPNTNTSYATTPYVDDFSAFGNTEGAPALARLYEQVREAGQTAAEHLAVALSEDATRLREVIACFQQLDHEQADRLCAIGAGDTLTVYSTQVHSSGSHADIDPPQIVPDPQAPPVPVDPFPDPVEPPPDIADDYVRAGQIERFEEIFSQNPGVVGADFNVEVRNDAGDRGPGGPRSAAAAEGFEESGHDIHAGRLDDQAAQDPTTGERRSGTSLSGFHIDYVITAPGIVSDDPQRVDGQPSDHDGQRIDITAPRW